MGSHNSTLAIINAGKYRVKVDIESFKAGKQKSSATVNIGDVIKINEKVDQSLPKLSAIIDPGQHYDFQLTKRFIGSNVKVTFLPDENLSKYMQHKQNHHMIITLDEEIVYSCKTNPWIEKSKENGEINHRERWNEWNNRFLKFEKAKNEVKEEYQRNRTEVSVKRQKKYKKVEEEYSIEKENVKNEAKARVEKLKEIHGIDLGEKEDFTQTVSAIPKNTKVENQHSVAQKLLEAGAVGLQNYLGNKS